MSKKQVNKLQDYFLSLDNEISRNIAIKLSSLDNSDSLAFNEELEFYPASLIKLFASFEAQRLLLEDAKHQEDISKAIKQSLKESDNDALSLLYDYISDTQSGLSLEQEEYEEFKAKRKSISSYFSKNIKLHAKCFSHAPYGRDLQLYKDLGSNSLAIEDIDLMMQKIINEAPSLLEYMSREGSDYQSEFIFKGFDKSKLDFFYSKAAWTSTVRHDTAYFSYQGSKYILTILTKSLSDQENLISDIAGSLFNA